MSTQPPQRIIDAARLTMAKWKIPASIQLAQWALESGWGRRVSADFNYWGMKALPSQPSELVDTAEYYKGVRVIVKAAFRSFATEAESFDAHGKLLATGKPYAEARSKLPDVFAFAQALGGGTPQRPRYATDPAYGDKLSAVIRGSNLTQYDKGLV